MPTPVGHALGGVAAALLVNSAARRPGLSPGLVLAAAAMGMAPDLDLLVGFHRSYTHSLGGVALVGCVAWLLMRRSRPHGSAAAVAMTAAHGSHLVLDWLGKDSSSPPGLMALWPFSSRFVLSGFDLFSEVSRRYWLPNEFIFGNLKAVGWEVLILLPILVIAWIGWSGRTIAR